MIFTVAKRVIDQISMSGNNMVIRTNEDRYKVLQEILRQFRCDVSLTLDAETLSIIIKYDLPIPGKSFVNKDEWKEFTCAMSLTGSAHISSVRVLLEKAFKNLRKSDVGNCMKIIDVLMKERAHDKPCDAEGKDEGLISTKTFNVW